MLNDTPKINGHGPSSDKQGQASNFTVKSGLARMLKGGVIMDVVNAEQVAGLLPFDLTTNANVSVRQGLQKKRGLVL